MRWPEHERTRVIPSVSEGPGRAGGAQRRFFASHGRDDRNARRASPCVFPTVGHEFARAGGAQRRPFATRPFRQIPRYAREDRSAAMTQRVLVTDTLADSGLAILRAASDVDLDYRPGLKGAELLAAVKESDALITRSGTAVTRELVNAGNRLRIV